MNGDGYIGGQGKKSFYDILGKHIVCTSGLEGRIEQATHVDFNGDGIIGRLPDTIPGGGFGINYGGYGNNYGGFPPGPY